MGNSTRMEINREKGDKFMQNLKLLLSQLPGEGDAVANYVVQLIRSKIFPLLSWEQIEKWWGEFPIFHPFGPLLLKNSHNVKTYLRMIEDLNKPSMTPQQLKFWRFTKDFLEPLIGSEESLSSEKIEWFNEFFTDEILLELEQMHKPPKVRYKFQDVKVLQIPQFNLPNSRGEYVNISDFKGKKNVLICILRANAAIEDYLSFISQNFKVFEDANVAIFPIVVSSAEAAQVYEEEYAKNKFPVYFDRDMKVINLLQLEEAIYGFQDTSEVDEMNGFLARFSRGGPVRLYVKEALVLIVVDKANIVQYAFYSNSTRRIRLETNGRYSVRTVISGRSWEDLIYGRVWEDLMKVIQELKDYKIPRNYKPVKRLKDFGKFEGQFGEWQKSWRNPFESMQSQKKSGPVPQQRRYDRAKQVEKTNQQIRELIVQAKKSKTEGNNPKTIEFCEKVLKINAGNRDAWKILETIYQENNSQRICGACRSYKLGLCETIEQPVNFLNPKAISCYYFLLKPSFV